MNESKLLTIKTAAHRLDVSPSLLYQMASNGLIRCYKIGVGRGTIRFSETHLQEYLATQETEGKRDTKIPPRQRSELRHLA